MSNKKNSDKVTPEKAVEILAKHGTYVTIEEAIKVLEFMQLLADLNIEQIEEDARKKASADINKKERPL